MKLGTFYGLVKMILSIIIFLLHCDSDELIFKILQRISGKKNGIES